MSSKAWCTRHGAGYDVDVGCLDCEAMPTPLLPPPMFDDGPDLTDDESDVWFPATPDDLDQLVKDDPFGAALVMDKKFGIDWRAFNEKQISDLLREYYDEEPKTNYDVTDSNDDSGKIT